MSISPPIHDTALMRFFTILFLPHAKTKVPCYVSSILLITGDQIQ